MMMIMRMKETKLNDKVAVVVTVVLLALNLARASNLKIAQAQVQQPINATAPAPIINATTNAINANTKTAHATTTTAGINPAILQLDPVTMQLIAEDPTFTMFINQTWQCFPVDIFLDVPDAVLLSRVQCDAIFQSGLDKWCGLGPEYHAKKCKRVVSLKEGYDATRGLF